MIGVVIAVLAGVLLWLLLAPPSRGRGRGRGQERGRGQGRGRGRMAESHQDEETVAAEQEVRDLDVFTTPEDADDELPDWGPGAPKQRR